MRNRLALLGALLFQPVLHLICFGKMALWYDQMRGEFCVSLPCKHSLRFFPLQYVGTAGSPKFKTNRCYLGPVGVTGDSWWWWFAQSAWEHGRWNCRKGIILAEHCTSCILHKGAVRCCKYDHLATALDGQVPGYNCRMQDLDLGFLIQCPSQGTSARCSRGPRSQLGNWLKEPNSSKLNVGYGREVSEVL